MATDPLLKDAETHMKKSLEHLEHELLKLRGGRANPSLIEDVKADYYGAPTPLKHMANLQRQAIEKAILEANLGFNPVVDEDVVRVKVPHLTEERRNELIRIVHERGEETKVAIRNARRDAKENLETMKNDGELPEDDFHREMDALEKLTHDFCDRVDEQVAAKDKQLKAV